MTIRQSQIDAIWMLQTNLQTGRRLKNKVDWLGLEDEIKNQLIACKLGDQSAEDTVRLIDHVLGAFCGRGMIFEDAQTGV